MGSLARVLAGCILATSAWAEEVSIHWAQPEPENVESYVLAAGVAPGVYTVTVEFPKPAPELDGTFRDVVSLPFEPIEIHVTLKAVGPGGESEFGNAIAPVCDKPTDVNDDGAVDNIDKAAVAAMNGQAVTGDTCKFDVNLDGYINSIDRAMVKGRAQ